MTETKYPGIFIEGTDVYKLVQNGRLKKLCQWVDNVGYYQVSFKLQDKRKYIRVHRLIAETLLPNPNNYPMINHKDANKLNNNLDNLEWCSNAYNTKEAYDRGVYTSRTKCMVKATQKTTGKMYEFDSIRQCAKQLGLNRKTITSILKNQKANNYDYNFEYI